MRFMRLAVGRGKSNLQIDDFMLSVLHGLTYQLNQVKEKEVPDANTWLPFCDLYKSKDYTLGSGLSCDSCRLFEPGLTNVGLCHAFNPTPTADLLTPSYFRFHF